MKQRLIIEKESVQEMLPYIYAEINALRIDTLYDECFRSVIKYSDNQIQANFYEEVWKKVYEHFND